MKSNIINALCISSACVVLTSCTTTTTATRTDPGYDQTKKRVYTAEQMRKTGEQTQGAALEKLDPSIRVSGSR